MGDENDESGNVSILTNANSGLDFAFGDKNSAGSSVGYSGSGRNINDFSGTQAAYGLDPSRYTVVGIDENGDPIVVERDPGVITGPGSVAGSGGGIGAVSGTRSNTGGTTTTKPPSSKNPFSGDKGLGNILGLLMALKALKDGGGRKTNATTPINPNKYAVTRKSLEIPDYVPYSGGSSPVMGRKNFEDITYTQKAAEGGLMGMARGGSAKSPRYLQGITDGMADKLSTNIDGKQPAALSHGEFVIPADVVSHLGNGNSEAGAKQLYKMMDRIRQARTGTKKQGKRINPEKFTPGGIAGYAGGGVVAFTAGGATGSGTTTVESNLSSWAAPGITDMVERGTALAKQPYQAYTGPLVAGTSPLQTQAFNTASNLAVPASVDQASNMLSAAGDKLGKLNYDPTKFGVDQFNTANMQQYMNPYLQMALDPQIAEARRQSEITQMGNATKLAQAGAYGGSRGALMQSEAQRNLGQNLADITGKGYSTAFDKAMEAFNEQQNLGLDTQKATEQSKQYGATLGLQGLQGQTNAATALGSLGIQENQAGINNLNAQSAQGLTQRGIEQEGIDALFKQYEQERLDPYKQIQFQQSLYKGLPIDTSSSGYNMSNLEKIMEALGIGTSVRDTVNGTPG